MPMTRIPKGLGPPTKKHREVPKNRADLRGKSATNMLKIRKQKIKRDDKGNITQGSVLSMKERSENAKKKVRHIAPDRRWFGNTRVIGQSVLEKFKEELGKEVHDPYSVVLNYAKLPTQLLNDPKHDPNAKIKHQMDFEKTFGTKKATRKRPKLTDGGYGDMVSKAAAAAEKYEEKGSDEMTIAAKMEAEMKGMRTSRDADITRAGQSKRIWGELYKVVDSADVLMQVLDARDPMGTRCPALEKFLREEKKHKHLVFVLNKCDLVPTWVVKKWVAVLSQEYPTVAFHASITNPFGKGNLISLLRQLASLQKANQKKVLAVGLIGYPNVGKSSVINTLRGQKVCNVAPIPGETKVWQYVAISKRIFLIDCPGVIHASASNDETNSVLKSVVRVERLGGGNKEYHVSRILEIVSHQKLADTYEIDPEAWNEGDAMEFLAVIAKKRGKLLAKGLPDLDTAAQMVLYDWQRAKIPWFKPPPEDDREKEGEEKNEADAAEGEAEQAGESDDEEMEEMEEDEEDQEVADEESA